jgi:hypothetical protein
MEEVSQHIDKGKLINNRQQFLGAEPWTRIAAPKGSQRVTGDNAAAC